MAIETSRIGRGPQPVLVLCDWFGGSDFWEPLRTWGDQERFSYHLVDYRGYGAARAETGRFDLDEMRADALALADAMGWTRFSLIGHSMSGKVAQLLAAAIPERLSSVVAMTPTPPVRIELDAGTRGLLESCATDLDARRQALNAATGSQYGEAVIDHLARRSQAASNPHAFRAYLDAWSQTDITARLGTSDYPLHVILGGVDPFVPEDFTRATTLAAFPKGDLKILPGVGHYPLLEGPMLTMSLVERLLAAA